jgi:hypothetical protein
VYYYYYYYYYCADVKGRTYARGLEKRVFRRIFGPKLRPRKTA